MTTLVDRRLAPHLLFPLIVLFTLAALSARASSPEPLAIQFLAQGLEVTAVTPGATVFVYGLAREPGTWTTNIVPRETRLTDHDQNGTVVWNLEKPFPRRSVWFAVELGSGRHAASAPASYPAQRVELGSTYLSRDVSGGIQRLSFPGSLIECIVVRPADGSVWAATAHAQSNDRASGSGSGTVTVLMTELQPRQGTSAPPPASLAAADVLFVLNSFGASYGVAQGGL